MENPISTKNEGSVAISIAFAVATFAAFLAAFYMFDKITSSKIADTNNDAAKDGMTGTPAPEVKI